MLDYELLQSQGVVTVHPESPILASDLAAMNEMLNRYLSTHSAFKGLMIRADDPLGLEELADWIHRLNFSELHPDCDFRIAAVTDDISEPLLALIAKHFSHAELKQFASQQSDQALEWVEHSTALH